MRVRIAPTSRRERVGESLLFASWMLFFPFLWDQFVGDGGEFDFWGSVGPAVLCGIASFLILTWLESIRRRRADEQRGASDVPGTSDAPR